MTPQATFLTITPIGEGRIDELRALLATMTSLPGFADPANELVPFGRLSKLHVARFVILEARTADELREFGLAPNAWSPALAFFGDFDGELESFLRELVACADAGLRKIFSFCEGFVEHQTDLYSWLRDNNIESQANYINWLGRTVQQVREEAALHKSLADHLKTMTGKIDSQDPYDVRQELLTHLELEKHGGRLTLTPPEPTPLGHKIKNFLHMVAIPLILLLFSPLMLIVAPFFFWRLRQLEKSDPVIFIRPERAHIARLTSQEDHDITNHFNVLGDVKPGLFRLMTLRFFLMLLDYSARHIYNHGYLTRIRTIHFARWVLIDNNKRVFFASNYDGSHESYMDDFINKVAWGLNLVFSNGVGYPPTRWLIKDGARQEQMYKYTLRRHQLPSEVWYKAYPGLSAFALQRNHRIRQGVETRPRSKAEIRAWLSLI